MYQLSRQQSQLLVGMLAIAVLLLSGPSWATAQGAFAHGTVVALLGTPHLWIADAQGTLHWAGDTRALAGRYINWSNRLELPLDQIQRAPRGDPWLTAGLLKDGDPIYLVKWETHEPLPRLLHIQSIRDVELFGINERNYGRMVIGRAQWEAHYGIRVSDLERTVLTPATGSVLAEWPPMAQKHVVFPIPEYWEVGPHVWPLSGKVRFQHSEMSIVLEGFPLTGVTVVTTLKRRDIEHDVLSILAVPERDYSGVSAEHLRDRMVNTVEDKIRDRYLRCRGTSPAELDKIIDRALRENPDLNPEQVRKTFRERYCEPDKEYVEIDIEREVTQIEGDLPVWRFKLEYWFNLEHWDFDSSLEAYFSEHSIGYLEYMVVKRGNVFWILEHSRANPREDRRGVRLLSSQRAVDSILNSLEFRY